MKKLLAVSAIFLGAQLSGAALVNADERIYLDFHSTNLETIDISEINCDKVMELARKADLFIAVPSGTVVAASSYECDLLESTDYDYFKPQGAYIHTGSGTCNVWSCSGVISGGSRDS